MATLTIQMKPRGERPRKGVIEKQLRQMLSDMPGMRIKVGLGASGEKYLVMLTGDDPLALQQTATAFERDLRTIPGLGAVISSASLVRQEIAVRPDFARAADLGVTSAAIGETLRIATMGDYDAALPKLNLAQRQGDDKLAAQRADLVAAESRNLDRGQKRQLVYRQCANLIAGQTTDLSRGQSLQILTFKRVQLRRCQ
mgnify:CR=1 FL=1